MSTKSCFLQSEQLFSPGWPLLGMLVPTFIVSDPGKPERPQRIVHQRITSKEMKAVSRMDL